MATVPTRFPMVSVRNPWGLLIQGGFKKIENRSKSLGKEFQNTWIALHVSKTFKTTEQRFARRYLPNHKELLNSESCNAKQQAMKKFFGSRLRFTDEQKVNHLIQHQLKEQLGNIIAFIMISKCVASEEGKSIDSMYCDQPFQAESHWVISDLVPLTKKEYVAARGHMGCARITDMKLNQLLYNLLTAKLKERDKKAMHEKQTHGGNVSQRQMNEEDDDIIGIMADLDNGETQNESAPNAITEIQSGLKRKHDDIDNIDTFSYGAPPQKRLKTKQTATPHKKIQKLKLSPVATNIHKTAADLDVESNKKRTLPTFISGGKENKTHRLNWMNHSEHVENITTDTNINKNDGFQKMSRHNSLYDMKHNQNKINLMIPAVTNCDNTEIASDIDAELEAFMQQIDEQQKESKAEVTDKVHKQLHSNPNETRRKEHLQLPDQYKWRIIVFDTETACFKPLGVIIDIGAVELINGRCTGRKFQAYIKPWAKIHTEAMKVHGITEQFLKKNADGDIYQVIQSFMEWIHSDCVCSQCKNLKPNQMNRKHKLKLVGHNVAFDIRQLNGAIKYCQSNMEEERRLWKEIDIVADTFDTMPYYKNVMGNYGNYSLDGMCLKFGIRNDQRQHAHGALIDAVLTAKCLQAMWKNNQDVEDRKCRNRFFVKKL